MSTDLKRPYEKAEEETEPANKRPRPTAQEPDTLLRTLSVELQAIGCSTIVLGHDTVYKDGQLLDVLASGMEQIDRIRALLKRIREDMEALYLAYRKDVDES